MLGISAEPIFLLVCETMRGVLDDNAEKAAFARILERFAMKPKLDWVHAKFLNLQARRVSGLPDNATLMVRAIYDLLRTQRNDLGHPGDLPPRLEREEMFAMDLQLNHWIGFVEGDRPVALNRFQKHYLNVYTLQIFPRFYETVEQLRQFLSANRV